ncbi:MAG: HAD-IA family hydrolase [Phaeodactylibacter sp.]|nr:HAD-IA family hydrolase [Phaeodactylibacter sp.]
MATNALPHSTPQSIELLIFDLDGTLVDSRFDLCDGVNYALEKLGLPQRISYEEAPTLLGSGLNYLIQAAAGSDDPALLRQASRYFEDYYSRYYALKTRPYHGVPETLAALSRFKKAVFSNKAQAFTTGIVHELQLEPYFGMVLGAQPGLYALKPDPSGIRFLLSELAVQPENALMVGDSTHDMEAARAAGIRCCAATYGYRPAEVLAATKPDFMIHNFEELKGLLG